MDEFLAGVFVVFVVILIVVISFALGASDATTKIEYNCIHYNKFSVKDTFYECKEVPEKP